MLEKPTIILTGAGASNCYGFPIGYKLLVEIYTLLKEVVESGNNNIYLKPDGKNFYSIEEIKEIYEQVKALEKLGSIDAIIEELMYSGGDDEAKRNLKYEVILRECIVDIISRYQDLKKLITNRDGWYEVLYQKLIKDCKSLDDLLRNDLTVITFNYERSLEFYLYNRLIQDGYSNEDASKFLKTLNFVHLYNTWGEPEFLFWGERDTACYDYQKYTDPDSIRQIAARFSLMPTVINRKNSSAVAEPFSEEFNYSIEKIKSVKRVFLLGINLNSNINMERLAFPHNIESYATVYNEQDKIEEYKEKWNLTVVENSSINDFLSKYL
jgi:hypothetical protein